MRIVPKRDDASMIGEDISELTKVQLIRSRLYANKEKCKK